MKDLWIEAHERLIEEYMDRNPYVSWDVASARTAPMVDERAADEFAAMVDAANND